MFAFIVQRLLQAVLVMVSVAFIAFMLFQYVGDPVVGLLGQDATPQQIIELRADLGLDKSFVVQFVSFLGNAVQGEANSGYGGYFRSVSGTGLAAISSSSYGIYAENTSATIPVAQFANLSGGIGLELIASTALKVTGAIKVTGGITAQPAFKIVSSAGNTAGHVLTIPNTTLANNTNDILIVTHNYSPTGIYLTKPYGVYWTGTNWAIFIEDFTAMAVGTAFNVLVIKQ